MTYTVKFNRFFFEDTNHVVIQTVSKELRTSIVSYDVYVPKKRK